MRVWRATLAVGIVLMTVDRATAEPRPDAPEGMCASIIGTYSDIHYNEEGGDLLGSYVRIFQSPDGRCVASVRHAEGALEQMVVGLVTQNGSNIEFDVKDAAGVDEHYVGRIDKKGFEGSYAVIRNHKRVVTNPLKLPRQSEVTSPSERWMAQHPLPPSSPQPDETQIDGKNDPVATHCSEYSAKTVADLHWKVAGVRVARNPKWGTIWRADMVPPPKGHVQAMWFRTICTKTQTVERPFEVVGMETLTPLANSSQTP